MFAGLKTALQWMGRIGIAFLVLLAGSILLAQFVQFGLTLLIFRVGTFVTGVWLTIRLLRLAAHHLTWRLRNRLLVTYLFISVVPILLIAGLAVTGTMLLARQLAVYLVTSELERRIDGLQSAVDSVRRTEPDARPAVMQGMVELFYQDRYPGIEVLVRDGASVLRYPHDSALPSPLPGWNSIRGVLQREGKFYLWCYTKTSSGDVTIAAPLTSQFLQGLVPDLGVVYFSESPNSSARFITTATKSNQLPAALNDLDSEFQWFAEIPTSNWDRPSKLTNGYLVVRSRVSAVMNAVFNRKADLAQGFLQVALIGGVIVFFIVEMICVVIGITMTRTITGAVHRLYEGTQKVIEGDFSHRIEVNGKDQLADLSRSFNSMTANVERLLVVAKEKERLQSEIEIAREVQSQLYPRVAPHMRSLHVTAVCQPARMVSGDYYDYELIRDSQIALAIGDVAGKGISAALLMATLQSSLRTQLQSFLEVATAVGNGRTAAPVSTSKLVSRLNGQLHSYTSAEKFATFLLGVFDEPSGAFTYTNAGHLPPLLVRDGEGSRLDVNGTVVGAFPFSSYGESRIDLHIGDLLVCFTDGITEPENEYGEMFGEQRLVDLIVRNADRGEQEIIDLVLGSVRQWTATDELQDDMTMLLARRV